jgi:ubiquinone/menaquinone biosynthesis C-methylase UbiE
MTTETITHEQKQTQAGWDAIATGYDAFVTPTHLWLGNEGLRRAGLRPGMRFLDVAAGSGALSLPAARLGARVLAVDLSPKMLARLEARAREEGLDVQTRVMDGHALELEDAAFDIAGSQFGIMLFPDMPRALNELARVTRPEGCVLMNVYGPPGQIDFLRFFVAAIQAAVPTFRGLPTDPPPLPFQLQDPEKLREALRKAGLKNVQVETITEKLEFKTGLELWNWLLNSNPIPGDILAQLHLTGEQTEIVQKALDRLVRERSQGNGAAVLTNPINIGVATK